MTMKILISLFFAYKWPCMEYKSLGVNAYILKTFFILPNQWSNIKILIMKKFFLRI